MWPFHGIAKQIQYTYISAFVLILNIVDRIQVFAKNESMSFHFKFHENSFLKFVVYNFGQIFFAMTRCYELFICNQIMLWSSDHKNRFRTSSRWVHIYSYINSNRYLLNRLFPHTAIVRNKTSLLFYKNITKTILSTLLSSWWEQLFSKRRVFSFLDESLLKQFLL